jgi:hypothetical protein
MGKRFERGNRVRSLGSWIPSSSAVRTAKEGRPMEEAVPRAPTRLPACDYTILRVPAVPSFPENNQ